MGKNKLKKFIEEILSLAGVSINGKNLWDIQVHNERFYKRVLTQGELGLGESYMDGWWDCEKLDEFIYRILRADLESRVKHNWSLLLKIVMTKIFNLQKKRRAFNIGEKHYDLSNDFFKNMLDKRMVYTGAYWKNAHTLDQAQENKLDLVCRKLRLKPREKILDIGCGWGSFLIYAAERYKIKGIGITVSKEQEKLGKALCRELPVEIRLLDYRDINESFNHIVSLGMIEHVGYKNYRTFMNIVHHCLKDNGLFLLQTIGGNTSVTSTDPWMDKYIFPHGMLPSIKQLASSIEGLFVLEDWQNLSTDYDRTLMAWFENLYKNWDNIKSQYNERFFRMWKYYLLSCAGSFRARKNQLWQIVLSKTGVAKGYKTVC
jgi:cyclopropane-fatty-acyl-phospholipid synthase